MSGIVGSKLNIRGSGLVGSLGSDGQHLLSAGAGKTNVFETVSATTYDDEPIKSDLTALAIREATNEASVAFNLPSSFIETFTDDTNLGTQTSGDRVSGAWGTISVGDGALETGDKTSVYTLSSSGITVNQTLSDWVDGTKTNGAGNAWYTSSGSDIEDSYILFDLGSGNSKCFVGAKMYHQNTSGAQGVHKWQGSTDNSTFVDLSDNFTWGAATTTEVTWETTASYRYIRVLGISGTTNDSTWEQELEFKIATVTGSSATGTLIQSANTVASAKTVVAGTMLYQDLDGTATLGTDLVIYFTCNGGTNWTEAASYNAITPVYSTGIKQVRLGQTTCTSGTDIRYKAVYANQAAGTKVTSLHAIGTNY